MRTLCKSIICHGIALRLNSCWKIPSSLPRYLHQRESCQENVSPFDHSKAAEIVSYKYLSNNLHLYKSSLDSESSYRPKFRPSTSISRPSEATEISYRNFGSQSKPRPSALWTMGCHEKYQGLKHKYLFSNLSASRDFSILQTENNLQGSCETKDSKPHYLYFHSSCHPETSIEILSNFTVVNEFVNEEEEEILMKELEPHLKRLQYEFDHWDDAIHGFRETERSRWSKAASPIISKMKKFGFPEGSDHIPQVHILDLAKTGVIKPHVDSARFCGNIICGLCLLSDAVMRLVHVDNKDQIIDIMLPRRALYVMKDEARYKYSHEVLSEKESSFVDKRVPRDRRVSVMLRNNPKEEYIAPTSS